MLSILMPTDFSENSMNAIKYALEFFKYQKTDFYFMHAYRNEFYDDEQLVSREVFDTVLESVKKQSKSNMDELLQKVEAIATNTRFNYHGISAFNTLVEEANQISDEHNIDLIVMGTKGKSDDRSIVFGSQTFQVLKYVQCPVLAIPTNYTNTQPKRILFPTNYLIPYKRRELKLLSVLAKSYRSTIDVLYVSKSKGLSMRQEDNQSFIKDTLEGNTLNFIQERNKSVSETIKAHLKDNSVDLLTMVNTQHSFLEDMLFPSTIDKVSLGLDIPLLAMQNTRRY
ncbi:universal stress protein [Subsaximicrobium wynnwilliamsii]|uniref:Universal stress protein n=1 Tax=Subsaximicrobium wynnwilliamsii TaxID=291179 RepID=A0A5C6ZAH7_9FLAO|nr:universal stress protein [Subsaximicrobium wynnwilliamsii]TXD81248.1 universal stress protein [Subsaximicrobium wynnwilliamsii]TXD86949.1 universal stress protein [Subsaximicrobium wynnwilliamsii]TXE00569.1 universal stress protein [Subsaximicrobium wynnwilliamsii]